MAPSITIHYVTPALSTSLNVEATSGLQHAHNRIHAEALRHRTPNHSIQHITLVRGKLMRYTLRQGQV